MLIAVVFSAFYDVNGLRNNLNKYKKVYYGSLALQWIETKMY